MTMTTLATVDQCAHPIEARSALQGGATFCTACQARLDAPQETVIVESDANDRLIAAVKSRKWGDEPDPIPVAPTVLVASTDPYVNADGDAARLYAPKPALAAAKDALAGGWRYEFTYAAAAVPTRSEQGKRGYRAAHVLHTIALRLARDSDSMTYDDNGSIMVHERGYAIWAREDEIANPPAEGKWAFGSAYINARQYGARELRARLLRQGRELLNDPTPESAAPVAARVESSPVPIAPIIPGSWASLHVGDVVTGADNRGYTVQEIERTGQWVGMGQPEVRVTLQFADNSGALTVRRPANETAIIAERSDASPAAAILAAVFNVTEETVSTMDDQFSAPATPPAALTRRDPPFGKYRWYKLPHPITGDTEAVWPRVSTIMKTHADESGLTDWKIRMAMKGLAISPDLIAMVASLDIDNDKSKFGEAIEQANNRATSKKGANFGTAVDRFTERLDGGESIASMGVPEGLRADVEAYARTLREHGLEVLPEYTQRTAVNVTHEYAGTWDRVVRHISTGELFALDLKSNKPDAKTGRMSSYSWLEYISQLAAYAYAEHMCTLDFEDYEPMPEVNKTKGLILHLPSGKGRGELYGVRLERGWHNFVRSIETRRNRSEAKSSEWSWLIDRPAAPTPTPTPPATVVQAAEPVSALTALVEQEMSTIPAIMPAVHALVAADILAAASLDRLGEVARNAIEADVWSNDLAALALGRDDQIRARTARDVTALAALWVELHPVGRWTPDVEAHADARTAELAQLVSA
jgi:hypothetical protein